MVSLTMRAGLVLKAPQEGRRRTRWLRSLCPPAAKMKEVANLRSDSASVWHEQGYEQVSHSTTNTCISMAHSGMPVDLCSASSRLCA